MGGGVKKSAPNLLKIRGRLFATLFSDLNFILESQNNILEPQNRISESQLSFAEPQAPTLEPQNRLFALPEFEFETAGYRLEIPRFSPSLHEAPKNQPIFPFLLSRQNFTFETRRKCRL